MEKKTNYGCCFYDDSLPSPAKPSIAWKRKERIFSVKSGQIEKNKCVIDLNLQYNSIHMNRSDQQQQQKEWGRKGAESDWKPRGMGGADIETLFLKHEMDARENISTSNPTSGY